MESSEYFAHRNRSWLHFQAEPDEQYVISETVSIEQGHGSEAAKIAWRFELYLNYCGIRVRDLERSLRFYTELFGLREVARGDHQKYGAGIYVLLRDKKSGQKLELNWYPEGSVHATPYMPGEGLDHLAFVVDDLQTTYDELIAKGAKPTEIGPASTGGWVAYVKDPDENWIEIYQHDPKKPTATTVPEGY